MWFLVYKVKKNKTSLLVSEMSTVVIPGDGTQKGCARFSQRAACFVSSMKFGL
jgi:hypothetical protein